MEINSSFYRSHQRATYERWSVSTPEEFQFSVKMPRDISHGGEFLGSSHAQLQEFLDCVSGLGPKLGVLLLQLPPSRSFAAGRAREFFDALQSASRVPVVCEPRHPTWFGARARALLERYGVGLVAADPPRTFSAVPTGRIRYYRLHGSPRIYYSSYGEEQLIRLAGEVIGGHGSGASQTWCIFDNTAAGAAWVDGERLASLMEASNNRKRIADLPGSSRACREYLIDH